MPYIRESIVTTRCADGAPHIAPMGIHEAGPHLVIAPFKPSRTLENLERTGVAVINYPDDVRVYAGCITGRRDWPVRQAKTVDAPRLRDCLAHTEVEVVTVEQNDLRPRYTCKSLQEFNHAPFLGFNRARSAVLEAAILVTRLHMLPEEKLKREIEYLCIAIDKTAGPRELEAWAWLMAAIEQHRSRTEDR